MVAGCEDAIEIRDDEDNLVQRHRCVDCPLDKLDRAVGEHPELSRSFDLDFALTCGIDVKLSEIDVLEWHVLKALRIERDRLQRKEIDKQRNQR